MSNIKVNLEYPFSPDYEYITVLERIDFDKEKYNDIVTNNGFIIGPPSGKLKKDLKDPNGIFSPKYGRTLKDLDPFSTKYRCECGHTMYKINKNMLCERCGKPVKYTDDNVEYFGWKSLKEPHFIIHPALYRSLDAFIGANKKKERVLNNILMYIEQKDKDGHVIDNTELFKKHEGELFFGIGMVQFRERFDEIMNFYLKKSTTDVKKSYYESLMNEREKIFTHSIPVFTYLFRPTDINQQNFCHEDTNDDYVMINRLASILNEYDKLNIQKYEKSPRDKLLYGLQSHINNLYIKLDKILQKKKGVIRGLLAGRYNFTSRSVITPNPSLRIDQITLPYKCLIEILQQRIINILKKTYNISGSDAFDIWYKANIKPDPIIVEIINTIIRTSCNGRGIPFIINRNPTISYGGILQMYCVGINFNFTMGVPLQILKPLAADFDGDVLNIMLIIMNEFYERANQIFNPRNCLYISRNDGMFNNDVNHQKDTIINGNTMLHLGDYVYTNGDLENIKRIQNKWRV